MRIADLDLGMHNAFSAGTRHARHFLSAESAFVEIDRLSRVFHRQVWGD